MLKITGLLAAGLAIANAYTAKALADKITNLPDLPDGANFNQFSGYIDVGPGRQIFYWYVESQNNPSTDPVVLWSNGGPGCSGLGGFLTEQGPFRVDENTKLFMNEHSWSTVANMVFVEQPAGVGFSEAPAGTSYGDKMAADDNYNFIVGFMKAFPDLASHDFYISSESYGGHYMPTLAKALIDGGGVPNFKGFAVGNPLTYMPYRNYGQYGTFAGHNLFPQPLVDEYFANGCDKSDASTKCEEIEDQMDTLTSPLDPYAIDFPVCNSQAQQAGRNERVAFMHKVFESRRRPLKDYFPAAYVPCRDVYGAKYLNRPDVQAAIHAHNKTWSDCSQVINQNYNISDVVAPMMPVYKYLIESGKNLNILVYSGDDDAVCATLGAQQWIWNMGLEVKSEWKQWLVDDQLAGYHVQFAGMHFATVHGAGHMVPATRPAQALEMFKKFLAGTW